MFSRLMPFIFGLNTSATTNGEENNQTNDGSEIDGNNSPVQTPVSTPAQRHRQHMNAHSAFYSGQRPQRQRNLFQRARKNNPSGQVALNASTVSAPQNAIGQSGDNEAAVLAIVEAELISQTPYVAAPIAGGYVGGSHGTRPRRGPVVATTVSEATPPKLQLLLGMIN